jgi:Protein of unknown function (DUF1207)
LRIRAVAVVVFASITYLLSADNVRAQSASPESQREPTWTRPSGSRFELFPAGDVFPVFVADPHRPTNSIQLGLYPDPEIPAARSPRPLLSAGGRFGMLRFESAGPIRRSWQISIEAGLDTVFDSQNRLDAIGWDGNYGLTLTTASASRLALKVAVQHVSAHLGDEYHERTGVQRLNYTREEVAFGAGWRFSPRWRGYGETGIAYRQGNDELEPWRVQVGIEYESKPNVWAGRFATYVAMDLSSMQERLWRLDSTLQGGIVTRSNGRTMRLFLELRDGRPTMGEFYKISETVITIGYKVDL